MQETSLPTSAERSSTPRLYLALAGWLLIAGLQIVAAFGLQEEATDEEPLYSYGLAVSAIVIYGFLVVLSLGLASTLGPVTDALGLRRFSRRWVWIAFAVTFAALVVSAALEPVLHGGEEQGLTPD